MQKIFWPGSKTLLLAMKMTLVLLTFACLHVYSRGTAQSVSLKVTNAPVVTVLEEIKKQTGYDFFYNLKTVENAGRVTIDMQNVNLRQVLDACFLGTSLTYSISDKVIVISEKETATNGDAQPQLVNGPPGEFHGRITNVNGEPLPGANVIIKRTHRGTITNAKGEFTLPNLQSSDIIIVSFVGFKSESIPVKGRANVEVILEVAGNELDKVVVQAYGSTTQRMATGSIVTVSKEQIERQPVMNVLSTLQGNVPGLVITQTSGYASAPFKVEIRGRSEISNRASEPLYVIDGVPLTVVEGDNGGSYGSGSTGFSQNGIWGPAGGQSPLFSINPGDVESISVLKDADATAIYGSRGAHGVILITTKKGRAGKTNFQLNVYQGGSVVTGRYKTLNTQQYLAVRREAFYNDSIQYGITPDGGNAYDLLTWDTTRYTNFQNEVWGGTGKTFDVEAAIVGGDQHTTFRVGGAYHHETSILNFSGADQRSSIQFNLSHKSTNQRLNIAFTSQYSFVRSDLVATPGNVATLPPDGPAFLDASGKKVNYAGWQPVPGTVDGFSSLFQPYTAKTGFLNSHLSVGYELTRGLTLSGNLGYSTSHNNQVQIYPISSLNPENNPTGSADFGNNNNQNTIIEPQLDYTGRIAKGKITALVGGSYQTVTQDGNAISGSGYVNDNLLYSIGNAPIRYATDIFGEYKYMALFTRINYSWADKYVLNLSARRDGSSKFGPGKQFGNFGAIGVAWIFTEEPWVKNSLSWLSFGKFRSSYGITGSDNLGSYQYLSRWTTPGGSSYQNGTIPAYIPIQHANPDLQWQVNKKLEFAMNLGFAKDRVNMEIAWYMNRCGNQLVASNLAYITGFNFVESNLPALVQNTGVEGQFRARILDRKDLSLNFNFNIGINRNKLLAFPNLSQSPYASTFIVGQPLNMTRLLHFTGVDPTTGEYRYFDKNHDGVINSNVSDSTNDLYVKDLNVRFDGGFGMDFRFKGLQLQLLFAYRKQQLPRGIFASIPGGIGNISTKMLDHWRQSGDNAEFARYTTQPKLSDYLFNGSDASFTDGSYIRLRNVSISYDFSADWIKKAHLAGCRIYARGENLFVLTKYDGIDPDAPGFGTFPPAKIFTVGLQLSF